MALSYTTASDNAKADALGSAKSREPAARTYPELSKSDWLWPLAFMLSLSMLGLQFPLGYLLVAIILVNRFFKDKYDFTIMFTVFIGGYALTTLTLTHIPTHLIAIFGGILSLMFLRKSPVLKKAVIALALYFAVLLALAIISEESLKMQYKTFTLWMTIAYFGIPLVIFAGHDFDMPTFFRKALPYGIIACAFYITDCYIFNGHILVPCSFMGFGIESTFYAPYIKAFGTFPRKYPPGLYLMVLSILPAARYYKIRWWQWLLVFGAFAASRTFTVISGLVVMYILFQPSLKRKILFIGGGIVALVAIYFVDAAMGVSKSNSDESTLRIKSSIDQIIDIKEAQDDADIAEAGSGRMAQAMPKLELLYRLNKQWTGLGFLSKDKTTVKKFVIENEYYDNPEEMIEVATNIEITVLQVLINIGYIGLAAHIIFFLYLYGIIRKLRYSAYYLSVLLAFAWFGIGGFEGWTTNMSLPMIGLAFATVLLENRDTLNATNRRNNDFLLNNPFYNRIPTKP